MAETLPGLLALRARQTPTAIALRQKRLGIWHEVSWAEHHAAVRAIALGLLDLGLQSGGVVALIGDQRPQWLQAELAVQAAGGIVVPLSLDLPSTELTGSICELGASFAIVEGQEQVDALMRTRNDLPSLRRVIYWDERGMRAYDDPWLMPLAELAAQPTLHGGSERAASDANADARFEAALARLRPDEVTEIVLSPGTDGPPRGHRLSHANLLAAARAFVEAEKIDNRMEFMSFAPNTWIGDRAFATAAALVAGFTVSLPEEPNTVLQDLQEIGPRLVIAPPLFWQRLSARAAARAEGSSRLRRSLIWSMLAVSSHVLDQRADGRPLPLGLRLRWLFAEMLICRPIRDHLGLLRARHAYSAGAPLPDETAAFLRSIGVTVKQMYLVTAAAGPVAVGERNVGRALPGVELRLSEASELLVRGSGVAKSRMDAAPASVAVREGWLCTGDLGRWEADGTLTLVGRCGELLRLSDGTELPARTVEQRLTASRYVRHAVALADDQPFVTALIEIDGPAVSAWAEARGIAATTYAQLCEHEAIRQLVQEAVESANARLPEGQRVRRWAILNRELSVMDGELTSLGTVRRSIVVARWASAVESSRAMTATPESGPALRIVLQ